MSSPTPRACVHPGKRTPNRGAVLSRLALLAWLLTPSLAWAAPTEIRLVPKPFASGEDDGEQRRAIVQPTVPSEYEEVPYLETAPAPSLSPAEKERGYLLFQRPITEPVFPNTNPQEHERLRRLVAFAAPGEFEPVTFSIYPVRDLRNLRVRCTSLTSPDGEIPADAVSVRLATYWNIGYPKYTSRTSYRRAPELLERVTSHSSPAEECRRYWLQIRVPDDASPGLYRGTVTVWDDAFPQAVEIPLALRVLPLTLLKDPAKHYSTYFTERNKTQYADRDEDDALRRSANEYRAMQDLGLDTVPTLRFQTDDGLTMDLAYPEDLERMLDAGLRGPVPVIAGNVIYRMYRDTTPDGERGSHWEISKLPPPEFYERITTAFRRFEERRKEKGWPEFICCPIDEVTALRKDFGARVYKAVKAAGMRTYATKDPTGGDAAAYMPYVDIWCSQPYSIPYEKIVGQDRYEYWCYPNHNACEIKDPRTMCKGGRMTYGFGFWRSGYTTLIPWHWSWTPGDDQFDYLRGSRSGCGQRIDEQGEVIPAIYWECFREGVDDARYLYTLQQAVYEREGSTDPECRRRLQEARALLQETWDAIEVQQKYLSTDMWPSEEFNARRWLLAQAAIRLLEYPATRTGDAPSVLVGDTASTREETSRSLLNDAPTDGSIESLDLCGDFSRWVNGTKEGSIRIIDASPEDGASGKPILRWRVHVDHESDGGEGGTYLLGWPRVARPFKPSEADFDAYDYLTWRVRCDSDRDEVADDTTPVGLTIRAHDHSGYLMNRRIDLGDRPREWIPLRFSIQDLQTAAGAGREPWRSISNLQMHVTERDYAHDTRLTFDIADVALHRFRSPTLEEIRTPRYVLLPTDRLIVPFDVLGTRDVAEGSHAISATLQSEDGGVSARGEQDLGARRAIVLDTSSVPPGAYQLKLEITTADGDSCSSLARPITVIEGPLAE